MSIRALLLALCLAGPAAADCPGVLASAERLLVVRAAGMNVAQGEGQLWKREAGEWVAVGAPWAMTLGRNGMGWSHDQAGFAAKGEKVKREGDGRTPAGIFAAGEAFGMGPAGLTSRRELVDGTVCVDDTRSPLYNRIARLSEIGQGMSHEKMWRIGVYRSGLVIRNATSRKKRGGSCIFLHVWKGPGKPTSGCIAAQEDHVQVVQLLFQGVPSAVAILPENALGRMKACGLPNRM